MLITVRYPCVSPLVRAISRPPSVSDPAIPCVPFARARQRRYVAGDNKDVHRRLWLRISEGIAMIVLIYSLRRDATVDDLAEDAAHGQESTAGLGADVVQRQREL